MVKGLDIFREQFRAFEGAFTLIGGAACDEWFTSQGLPFRATKDLDIVLMIEVLDPKFVAALWAFVKEGEYEVRERNDGKPVLYRFAKPVQGEFPYMLELFSRSPDGLKLGDGQEVIPVRIEPDHHSLSAILLDDAYYGLIQRGHDLRDGLRVANATALIPLKSRRGAISLGGRPPVRPWTPRTSRSTGMTSSGSRPRCRVNPDQSCRRPSRPIW